MKFKCVFIKNTLVIEKKLNEKLLKIIRIVLAKKVY